MLKHVLIPLDGSLLAERAFEPAKNLLRPQGKITLITAVHNGHVPIPETSREAESSDEDDLSQLNSYLERIAANLKLNGYEVDFEIRDGEPADVIVEIATKFGVEIIVMCTHGRTGLSRLLTGSVTLEVLNTTPCPVLVIPNRERVHIEEEAPDTSTDLGLAPGT
jgi:nucleotide-binding universal stress UspA family protein